VLSTHKKEEKKERKKKREETTHSFPHKNELHIASAHKRTHATSWPQNPELHPLQMTQTVSSQRASGCSHSFFPTLILVSVSFHCSQRVDPHKTMVLLQHKTRSFGLFGTVSLTSFADALPVTLHDSVPISSPRLSTNCSFGFKTAQMMLAPLAFQHATLIDWLMTTSHINSAIVSPTTFSP